MRGSTMHEQRDHRLGLRLVMWLFWEKVVCLLFKIRLERLVRLRGQQPLPLPLGLLQRLTPSVVRLG